MKILLAIVVLTGLALAGSRRSSGADPRPFAIRAVFGGIEYVVIGLLLGSQFIDLIDGVTLDQLRPFIAVALGWIGFLFGLQFDRRTVLRLPAGFLTMSFVQAAVTFVGIFSVVVWALREAFGLAGAALVLAALMLAASASCSGHTGLGFVPRSSNLRSRHISTVLRFISSLDPVGGVLLFGGGMTLMALHPLGSEGLPWALQWLVIAICLGLLSAWIFVSLTLTRTSQPELVLYLIGTIALASGVAFGLGLSILLVGCVCGVTFANLTHVRSVRGRVMDLMARGERFLYLLLLVLVGAMWSLPTRWVVGAALGYVAIRLVAKLAGGWLATRGLAQHHAPTPWIGLGLVSQSGMAVAIIVEYQLLAPDPHRYAVASVAVLAVICNELVAPWLAAALVGAGEDAQP